jgi:hypothetical protein
MIEIGSTWADLYDPLERFVVVDADGDPPTVYLIESQVTGNRRGLTAASLEAAYVRVD